MWRTCISVRVRKKSLCFVNQSLFSFFNLATVTQVIVAAGFKGVCKAFQGGENLVL
jgi:hypothetical protein